MRIEFDSTLQQMIIDNVAVSFEALQAIVNPKNDNYQRWLRFERVGNIVTVYEIMQPKGRDFSEFVRE